MRGDKMNNTFSIGKYRLTIVLYKADQGGLFGAYIPGYVSSQAIKFGFFRYRFTVFISVKILEVEK